MSPSVGVLFWACFFATVHFSAVSGESFSGYIYPTPTPTPAFDGYVYTTPSCPLLDQPVPSCTASATVITVPVRVNVTETIVTYIKVPTTTTLIVPTTSTEIHRAVETRTNYHTTTHTERVPQPPVTRTSTVTDTIARVETVTSPVVRVEHVTERFPVVEYRTDTVTKTSTCTVTELFPTTYYSTYISTSYAPPLTDTSFLTETAYRTLTSTLVSTLHRTQTSSAYITLTETIRSTRTLTDTKTVTASCVPPPLNNEYLPVAAPSNDYLPPHAQQQAAEQRLRSNFVLPEDLLLPPKRQSNGGDGRSPSQGTVSVTVTKTLDPVTLTKEHTVTRAAGGANDATSVAAVRTKSVIAFNERVTKLVTVTPTLTSYIYMDTVTVTTTRPAALKAG